MKRKSVGLELRCVNNLIGRYVDNFTHKKMVEEITGTNGWIIDYLSDNTDVDIYQKDLEQQFSITRSTASKVLNLMEHKGLIERQSVAHDARLKKIVLTLKACELKKMMAEDGKRIENMITKGFTEEETNLLFDYLERIKVNIKNELN